jgi:ATP-dependent exoDNAse (exonuclease V) alpha subunit
LNRELIYTGLSRAKDKVFLVANFDILKGAVQKKTSRTSGFRDAILTAPDFH